MGAFDDLIPAKKQAGAFDDLIPKQPAPAGLPVSERGDFERGLDNYIPQTKQTLGYAGAITGEGLRRLGLDGAGSDLRDYGLGVAAENAATVQAGSKPYDQFSGIRSVGDAVDWVQYNAGQAVGNLAESLAVSGAGALLGSAAPGVGTVGGAAAGLLGKTAVKTAVKEAGEKVAKDFALEAVKKRAATGAKTALAASALTHGVGETTGNVVQDGRKLEDLSGAQYGKVWAGGAASGGLEYLADKIGLDALLKGTGGSGSVVGRTLRGAGAVGAKEAGTEVAQTMAQRAGAEQALADSEAFRQYLDSAAGGFVQGGMIGGAGEAVQAVQAGKKSIVDRIIGSESSGDAKAKNPLSSAEGLGQFIDSTWLAMVKKHRPDIAQGKSREQLLAMKFDPALSREMTAAYADDNRKSLEASGFAGSDRNVYMAHVFGDGGAKQLLRADPAAPVSSVVTAEVLKANPFMRGKSVGQVINIIGKKVGDKDGAASTLGQYSPAQGGDMLSPAAAQGIDPMLTQALADVQPEPMMEFDNPDDAEAMAEADLMAQLEDEIASLREQGSDLQDLAGALEKPASQDEAGGSIGQAAMQPDSPDAAALIAQSTQDLAQDPYALAERAAIQQVEGGTQVDVGDEVGADVPFPGQMPVGLKRDRKLDWEVRQGYHPAVSEDDFTGDVPFSRNLDPQGQGAGRATPVQWRALPDQRDAMVLSQAVGQRLGSGGTMPQFTAVAAPAHIAPAVATLQQVFGKKVVFVQGQGAARQLFQGAVVPSKAKNRIFVNVDSKAGYVNVIGHELYEHIARDRPDLHQWFADAALRQAQNLPAYRAKLQAWENKHKSGVVVSEQDAMKELLADFTGDALADPDFLRALAADNPGKFRQFANTVLQFLKSLVAKLNGQRTSGNDAFFKDVQALRANLQTVLNEYVDNIGTHRQDIGKNIGTPNVRDDLRDTSAIEFMRFPETEGEAKDQLNRIYQAVYGAIRRGISQRASWPLHMMSFNGLVDRYGKLFRNIPGDPMKGLETGKRMMQAVMQHWAQRFQQSHDAFMRLSAEQRKQLTGVMLDATLLNIHPDRDYKQSIDVVWARKRIKKFENELAGIAADERKQRHNQAMSAEQRQLATVKAQAGIKALERKIQQENKRAMAYPELVRKWEALGDQQRDVYHDWMGQLNKLWEKQTEALENRIADIAKENNLNPATAEAARKTVADLRLQFRKQLELGPYFPLKRYGDSIVQIREGGEYARYHFNSEFEARQFADKVQADKPGAKVLVTGKFDKDGKIDPALAVGTAGKLLNILQESGTLDKAQLEQINRFVIEALPDLSARKGEMRRYFVEGADQDMERGFANAMLHGGHDLGRILFGHKIEKHLNDMKAQVALHSDIVAGKYEGLELQAAQQSLLVDEKDLPQAARVIDVMGKQVKAMMNPDTSPVAAFMGNLNFVWYLGASPMAGLINLTQTQQVTFPVLAARFGAVKAQAALMKAAWDVMKAVQVPRDTVGQVDIRQSIFGTSAAAHLTDEERAVLQALEMDGTTETTQANSLARTASGDGKANMGTMALRLDRAMAISGFFFHNAEIMNRQVAQLAAMRLMQQADPAVKAKLNKEHGSALDYARWITERTHFDYSHANRSMLVKGNTAKLLLPMKNYSLLMTEFLLTRVKDVISSEADPEVRRLARAELLHVMGMTALMAGASGLPMGWLVFMVANMLGGDEDEPWDAEAAWAQFLRNNIGETGEALVNRGAVNAFTGLDLSSRIGLSSLFVHEAGIRTEGQEYAQHFLEELAGVSYALIAGMADGVELIQKGETQKGIEKMLPVVLRNPSKALRYATDGLTTRTNDEILPASAFNAWEIANQAIGMAPDKVTAAYDKRTQMDTLVTQMQHRRSGILRAARQYQMDGKGNWNEVLRDIRRWNQANPKAKITTRDVAQSVKSAKTRRAGRERDYGLNIPKMYREQMQADGWLQ